MLRLKNFVTDRAQNQLRKFGVVFKVALFFFGDVAGRRVVAVKNFTTRRLNRHVAKFVFEPTYLRRAERIVRRGKDNGFRPKIFVDVTVVFVQPRQNALAVLATARLPYINFLSPVLFAEQKINTVVVQAVKLFAVRQVLARNAEDNARPAVD